MIDPVCGMQVGEDSAFKLTKDGKEYFFCSRHCKGKFAQPFFKNRLFLASAVLLVLVSVSYLVPFLAPLRAALLNYIKKIWWAVTLGLLLGGVIEHYIPREYISKVLSRRSKRTIFNAVFLGFLMSACSHGILALSIQLYKKGASVPAVVSFLLASPWANFTVTVMLFGFFGVKALFIIFSAILVALNTGFIFILLDKKGLIEKNSNTAQVNEKFSILKDLLERIRDYRLTPQALKADINGIVRGAWSLADMVLWWVLLGVILASIAGTYIPTHFFHRFMGPTLAGLGVTLLLATVIEVCSEGSSPLAFEIYRNTHALGNSFAFLMAGVATDYTEIGLLWANVGRRTALWLPAVAVPQVILLGFIANKIF